MKVTWAPRPASPSASDGKAWMSSTNPSPARSTSTGAGPSDPAPPTKRTARSRPTTTVSASRRIRPTRCLSASRSVMTATSMSPWSTTSCMAIIRASNPWRSPRRCGKPTATPSSPADGRSSRTTAGASTKSPTWSASPTARPTPTTSTWPSSRPTFRKRTNSGPPLRGNGATPSRSGCGTTRKACSGSPATTRRSRSSSARKC